MCFDGVVRSISKIVRQANAVDNVAKRIRERTDLRCANVVLAVGKPIDEMLSNETGTTQHGDGAHRATLPSFHRAPNPSRALDSRAGIVLLGCVYYREAAMTDRRLKVDRYRMVP